MKKSAYYDLIRYPMLTEKTMEAKEAHNQYAFAVDRQANKVEIKKAVEALFKVKVQSVRTQMVRGKVKRVGRNMGKRPDWKKAVVTLLPEQKIEFFEGV
ncbi:MAG: 50S ribosomal protein L23 [Deltaproteobacteria bacterium]|nr:50S ribosomal protein L23 [Candidatus Anaeroferrophillus wilburensis]MBN2889522.1 50S ribosomal protein L23 [Deltaproteobacteria bacterium]